MIRRKKNNIASEFIDSEGKKWIQSSADDIFSSDEIGKIIRSIEKEKSTGEIVLASIDFKKVNKEYYEAVENLNRELKKKDMLLKKLASETKILLDRKNKKLYELIEYIKKLHILIKNMDSGNPNSRIELKETVYVPAKEAEEEVLFEKVREYFLDENGNEIE